MEPKTLLDTDVLSGFVHPTGGSGRNHNERSRDRRPRDPCRTMPGRPRGYRERKSHFVVQVTERFGTRPVQSLGTEVVAPALPSRRSSKSSSLRGLPACWTRRARKSPVPSQDVRSDDSGSVNLRSLAGSVDVGATCRTPSRQDLAIRAEMGHGAEPRHSPRCRMLCPGTCPRTPFRSLL